MAENSMKIHSLISSLFQPPIPLRHSRGVLSGNLSGSRRSPLRLVPTLDWVACGDDVFLLGSGLYFVGGEL